MVSRSIFIKGLSAHLVSSSLAVEYKRAYYIDADIR